MRTFRTPWDTDPQPAAETLPEVTPRLPKKRGRRPTPTPVDAVRAPDGQGRWLYHHLTITGPPERIAAFAEAARGSGIVPWRVDGARIEEDVLLSYPLQIYQGLALFRITANP